MSQLMFNGKVIGHHPRSFADVSPTLRMKSQEIWGVNGEMVMTGGFGGRPFSFVCIVKAKSKKGIAEEFDKVRKEIGKVGKVKIFGSRTIEEDIYDDCLLVSYIRPESPFPDVAGNIISGGWIAVDVVFNFRQLRVE